MEEWMYENADFIGFAIVAVVLWLVADRIRYARRGLRKNERRRLLNTLRGALMSQADSDKFFLMRFEDAIENEIQELKWEGRMNDTQERNYRALFKEFGMIGLYPMEDKKRSILQRLKKMANDERLGRGRPLGFINGNRNTPAKPKAAAKRASKYAANDGGS